ncbi:hypothetical protein B4135_1160 [Caldibacillus debilis]|uniref:Uncharacterized protein n=1 Tax=Caldibacillus debilis TaxID=301148 RepID=A0A150MDQ2_9BACI|nr:hypothetical protein B4135_1160 [Caldibacillus debilis]
MPFSRAFSERRPPVFEYFSAGKQTLSITRLFAENDIGGDCHP